jgi:hypothetical protein
MDNGSDLFAGQKRGWIGAAKVGLAAPVASYTPLAIGIPRCGKAPGRSLSLSPFLFALCVDLLSAPFKSEGEVVGT